LTSGLVLIAKTKQKASEMGKQMMNRDMQKTYLARVKGKFPDGVMDCDAKLEQISHKIGIHCVTDDGRESNTRFTFISFNGITSLVKCWVIVSYVR
jgi:23S rRNA-/tRNA-specific pseudouridylate synthase